MQTKYMRPPILQVCVTAQAKLAEAETSPEMKMELKRIAKVEKWMKQREEEAITVVAAKDMVAQHVRTLYRWEERPSFESTRPQTFRESKLSAEAIEAVLVVRQEQRT